MQMCICTMRIAMVCNDLYFKKFSIIKRFRIIKITERLARQREMLSFSRKNVKHFGKINDSFI